MLPHHRPRDSRCERHRLLDRLSISFHKVSDLNLLPLPHDSTGQHHNRLGETPMPTMLHACTTFNFSRSASANASSDSVPGFSHSSSQPRVAMSGNNFNNTDGGT